jgi:hypothetical protein
VAEFAKMETLKKWAELMLQYDMMMSKSQVKGHLCSNFS